MTPEDFVKWFDGLADGVEEPTPSAWQWDVIMAKLGEVVTEEPPQVAPHQLTFPPNTRDVYVQSYDECDVWSSNEETLEQMVERRR